MKPKCETFMHDMSVWCTRMQQLEKENSKLRGVVELAATRNDNGDYVDPEYLYRIAASVLNESKES